MGGIRNISHDISRAASGSRVRPARLSKKDTGDKPKRPRPRKEAVRKPLVISGTKGQPDYEEFDSVWEALGFSPLEAANLEARAALMLQLREIARNNKWTQAETAKKCGVSQPRINDLMRGNIDKFSIDALVNMAAALGRRVDFQLVAA